MKKLLVVEQTFVFNKLVDMDEEDITFLRSNNSQMSSDERLKTYERILNKYTSQEEINFYGPEEGRITPLDVIEDEIAFYEGLDNLMKADVEEYISKRQDKTKLIQALEDYIELLGSEIDSLVGIASAHHWVSDNVEEGIRLRKLIQELKK